MLAWKIEKCSGETADWSRRRASARAASIHASSSAGSGAGSASRSPFAESSRGKAAARCRSSSAIRHCVRRRSQTRKDPFPRS